MHHYQLYKGLAKRLKVLPTSKIFRPIPIFALFLLITIGALVTAKALSTDEGNVPPTKRPLKHSFVSALTHDRRTPLIGSNRVVEQYLQSINDDYTNLEEVMVGGNASQVAKNAKYLLCSVEGFENWALENNKKSIAAYTSPIKTQLALLITQPRVQKQYEVFLHLTASLQKLRNNVWQDTNDSLNPEQHNH